MGIYFGTDGFRGIYGEVISPDIAYKVGNSLGGLCQHKKVIIGRDTRRSGSLLALSFASGLMSHGVEVVDIGIAPTPVIAYLTKALGYDYGIVISASHNPRCYNGIKIFDKDGFKLTEELESIIERKMLYSTNLGNDKIGRYYSRPRLIRKYKDNIVSKFERLDGLKIVIDLANGASTSTAKDLFTSLGANVIVINNGKNGKKINHKCGALYPDIISDSVKKFKADMGFAFDGDADRIIGCNEKGEIIDGDDILYILSNKLSSGETVVGTSMTNKGLEVALAKKNISLLRADVGDKYVVELMKNKNSKLGGETSGHIIDTDFSTTGDGVLTAINIASLVKKSGTTLSKLITFKHYPQVIKNVEVIDKYRILNSDFLSSKILSIQNLFGSDGRVLVRASGTESKIRVMCEHINQKEAEKWACEIESIINSIDQR